MYEWWMAYREGLIVFAMFIFGICIYGYVMVDKHRRPKNNSKQQ